MNYNDLRAAVPGTVNQLSKLAQMDVQESQLEADFAKLAYMFVSDRAAQMMRYLLGFEVVEHEPDGSRAVGVFGFKVGGDYYYVPAFFITNQVRGIDMIFSKKTNLFMPLTEEWIDNIIQRDVIELGDSTPSRKIRPDFENPNFDFIRTPRIGAGYSSKAASDSSYEESEEGKSLFKAAWDAMCKTTAEKLAEDPAMCEAVAGFVGAMNGKQLSKKAGAGDLSRWLSEQGGPAAVSTLFDALCTNVKFANAALSVYPDIESLHVHQFKETAYGCKKAEEPELKIRNTASEDTSDKDRQRLLVDGFYIDDKRDPQSLSKTYNYDHALTYCVADQPGKYSVLMSDGTTSDAWVLDESPATRAGAGFRLVLTDPVGHFKMRGACTSPTVYVKGDRKADVDGLYDNAIPLTQMEVDTTYTLIDRSGKFCITSFRPSSVLYTPGENDKIDGWFDVLGNPSWSGDYINQGDFDKTYRHDSYRDINGNLRGGYSDRCVGLTLTKNTGKAVRAGNRILVPSNYRAVKLIDSWDIRSEYARQHGGRHEDQPRISLGDITSLRFDMQKAAFHDLTVLKDGPEFYVKIDEFKLSRPYNYKQACQSLNGCLGLSVAETEQILAKTAESGQVKTHIHLGKAAQFVGAPMPNPPAEVGSVDPYSGVQMYGPYEAQVTAPFVGAPMVPHGNPYGENLGGEGETQQNQGSADSSGMPGGDMGSMPIDQEAMDLATQAGELGQRHVFDYSSIGGLAKVYDTGSLIDSYIPQFLQAVDRLGRVLFLYYWKNEDFGERYGTSETIEMEDTLRSVFKQFGNLTLTLRQKAIEVH